MRVTDRGLVGLKDTLFRHAGLDIERDHDLCPGLMPIIPVHIQHTRRDLTAFQVLYRITYLQVTSFFSVCTKRHREMRPRQWKRYMCVCVRACVCVCVCLHVCLPQSICVLQWCSLLALETHRNPTSFSDSTSNTCTYIHT